MFQVLTRSGWQEIHPSRVEDDHAARCLDCNGLGCPDCGYSGEGFAFPVRFRFDRVFPVAARAGYYEEEEA